MLECPFLGVRRAKAALAAAGHKVSVASFDVTLAQACREGVAAIEQDSGVIDILVNNAGMQFRSPLEDFLSRNGSNCSPPMFRAHSMSARPLRVI